MYDIYELSLDDSHKDLHKHENESKLEIINDTNILTDMNFINDKDVNNIS